MDKKSKTAESYNLYANAHAERFDASGARREDIDFIFSKTQKVNPVVLEIGCGNGRDAEEIVRYTANYTGIDISEKLIEIATKKVKANFIIADVEEFQFGNYDIVIAFASLLHLPKESLEKVIGKIQEALPHEGLFFISMKLQDKYMEETQEDGRTFYFYSEEDLDRLLGNFSVIKKEVAERKGQMWYDALLKK